MINNKLPQLTTMSEEEINKRFDGIANPNIIANGDFVNLVNTTGKKEFVKGEERREPIFDGWSFSGGNTNYAKVILQDDGVLLDSGTSDNGIQAGYTLSLEDSQYLSEKTVTFSREIVNYDGSYSNSSIQVIKNSNYLYTLNPVLSSNKYTYQIPKINEGEQLFITIHSSNNNGIGKTLFKWIKLEIGDKATPLGYVSQAQKQLETDGVPLLYGGKEITANSSLNSYVNIGNYYCASNSSALTLKNKPIDLKYGFTMNVKCSNGYIDNNEQYNSFLQKIEDLDGKVFKRTFSLINGNYNFGNWTKTDTSDISASQLSTIENLVRKSNQDIIDEYTLELIEQGVIK